MRATSLAIGVLLLAAGSAAARIPQEELARAASATVLIRVDRYFHDQRVSASGTGFFIDGKGHVLTNSHLVAPEFTTRLDGRDTEVTTTVGSVNVVVSSGLPDEQTLPARVLRLDRARELALLEVAFSSSTWLDVSAPPEVAPSEAVLVLGYPLMGSPAAPGRNAEVGETRGHVGSIRRSATGETESFQLAPALNPGYCGGPVLDGHGDAVGVACAASREGTGAVLAIAPGWLRQFSDEAQFEVRLTPPWISGRRDPMLVEVLSLLRSVGGLSGQVTVAAGTIEIAKRDLTVRLGSLTAQLVLPVEATGARIPPSYTLAVRLSDAAGRTVFRHAWAVPAREGGVAAQASERGAANGSPGRQDLPSQPSTGGRPLASSQPAPLPGNERDRQNPLAQLASGVKLGGSGDAAGLVVTNSNLGRVAFVVVEVRYAALPPELRAIALEFDRAEFTLGSLTVGVTYGSEVASSEATSAGPGARGPFVSKAVGGAKAAAAATVSQESSSPAGSAPRAGTGGAGGGYSAGLGQEISNARATEDAARAKVLQNRLCRCPDHTWFRSVDRARCPSCAPP